VAIAHDDIQYKLQFSTKNWESDTIGQSIRTDEDGKFIAKFKKGEAVDINIKSTDCQPKKISKTLRKSKVHFEVYLERII